MSIRFRIALLVGLAILGGATFAAVQFWSAWRLDGAMAAQEAYDHLDRLTTDALASSQRLASMAEQFIRERDAAAASGYRAEHAQLMGILNDIARVPKDGEVAERLNAILGDAARLERDFADLESQALRLGLNEDEGLRGRLRKSVKAMENELVMWPNMSQLMVPMLQMRQAEKDFMLYGSEQYLGNHARYAGQFDLALDGSGLPASVRDDFAKILTSCRADMRAFGEVSLALRASVETLRTRQGGLQPLMEHYHAYARSGLDLVRARQQALRAETGLITLGLGILALASLVISGVVIAMGIVRPLRTIETSMSRLAEGDHDRAIPCVLRPDEIGDMARAVEVFRRNAAEMSRMQLEMERVRRDAEASSRSKVLALAASFENTVRAVTEVVSSRAVIIHDNAGGIAGTPQGEPGDGLSLRIAEAAEAARQSVSAITQATMELMRSVEEVSENGRAVDEVVETAVCELTRAEMRVRSLSETADRIDRVVGMIGDVAQRTNMLSMNATIEASRAGEAGKGFAVVAAEVKRLAHQTAESAKGIAVDVEAIQAATAETVAGIAGVGAAIRQMDGLSVTVRASVARQADVARRIEQCVAEVSSETTVLSDGVASFTHVAAKQCGAAAQVLWAAEDLEAPTRTLQDEVKGFLSTVRAA